jgi:hypothetical protein
VEARRSEITILGEEKLSFGNTAPLYSLIIVLIWHRVRGKLIVVLFRYGCYHHYRRSRKVCDELVLENLKRDENMPSEPLGTKMPSERRYSQKSGSSGQMVLNFMVCLVSFEYQCFFVFALELFRMA